MNPQQQLPTNYLDQIAPQAPKRSFMMNKTRLIILIGIAAVIGVIILSVVLSGIANGKKEPWEQLDARLTATSEIVASSQGKIKNSQLLSTNSTLKISLTNTQRDLGTPLLTANVDVKNIPKSVLAAESSTASLARLEDARLNAKYDSTYAREMSYQLSTLLTLLKQLYASSSNPSNQTFLKATYDNIEPVQTSFSEFNASNE